MIHQDFDDNILKRAWAHFFGAQLNGFKYFYLRCHEFTINNLLAHIKMVTVTDI